MAAAYNREEKVEWRLYGTTTHSYSKFYPFYTIVLQLAALSKKSFERALKPNFKLEPYSPVFNVRFYCIDGRFYYPIL